MGKVMPMHSVLWMPVQGDLLSTSVVKVRGLGGVQPPCSDFSPLQYLIESIKCYFMPK